MRETAVLFVVMAGARAGAQLPAIVSTPTAPNGATVLFSGKADELSTNWTKRGSDSPAAWKLNGDAMVSGGGDILTKESFADCQLHVEFKIPLMSDKKGQSRGNSGVKLQGRYEIQILDSYGKEDVGTGDCGAVYTIAAPLVNACRPPEQWQTYEIVFRAPRTDADGNVTEKGRVTVWQNGILVQNNTEIPKPTGNRPLDRDVGHPGPIMLQDHGCKVEFRNIWIRRLPMEGAKHY